MKVTYKVILVLAVLSIAVSIVTLYLDSFDVNTVQDNSSYQFQVGVTVRPKNPTTFQKMRLAIVKWFE